MSSGTEPRDVVEAYHQQLWGEQDLSAIDRFVSPEALVHVSSFDSSAAQTIFDDATRYFAAFSDIVTSRDDLITQADKAVLRWSTVGTHVGPYGRVQPTQRRVTMAGIDIFAVRSGLIVECWSVWDGLDVFDQLGALPELW